ncbi:recombinase family protein [Gammaproteobacteria bacterium]|nr:recombinase family protein [Gammaproteobacteria bacterium]
MKETLHLYRRVSSAVQSTDGDSLSSQLQLAQDHAKKLGMKFKDWNEGAKSSAHEDIAKRPVLLRLLNAIDEGKVKHLYAFHTDRLSRNEETWFVIRSAIKSNDVILHTQAGQLDLNSPQDNFISKIMGASAQYTNELARLRSVLGKENRIRKGGYTGGAPNFGYATVDKQYAIDKEEAKWVRKMFNLAEKGGSIKDIKTMFDTNGVKPRRSKLWNIATLQNMIQNKIYIGEHEWKGIKISTPPIIKQSQFNRVQKLYGTDRWRNHNTTVNEYFLTGLLHCGHCGSRFNGWIKKDRGLYVCPTKQNNWRGSQVKKCDLTKNINIKNTDEVVWDTVIETVGSSNYMKEKFKRDILDKKDKKSESIDEKMKKLDTQIARHRKQEGSTLDSISLVEVERIQGRMDEEVYQLTKDRLTQELQHHRSKIEEIEDEISMKNNEKSWLDWVGRYGLDIEKKKDYSLTDKKGYCTEVVDKIVVNQTKDKAGHTLEIRFKQPIVDDRLKYNDESDKRKGYQLVEGKKKSKVYLKVRPKKKVTKTNDLSALLHSN